MLQMQTRTSSAHELLDSTFKWYALRIFIVQNKSVLYWVSFWRGNTGVLNFYLVESVPWQNMGFWIRQIQRTLSIAEILHVTLCCRYTGISYINMNEHKSTFLSLVSKPHDFIQPDLNGDGARDLDPIGNLGRLHAFPLYESYHYWIEFRANMF